MDNSTAPAGKRTQISLVFPFIRRATFFVTARILGRATTSLASKPRVWRSPRLKSSRTGLRGAIVSLFFAISMMSLPATAMVRTAEATNQGIEIPGQSAGAFPPVPYPLWLLGLVLVALIVIARRRFK